MDLSLVRSRLRSAGSPSSARGHERDVPGWFGRAWPGALVGLALGLLALGPGLRRGFLLTYDMLFVPREPFSSALPGLAPPRAVPSDIVMAVVTRALPADIVQKIVLLSIFVLACSGMAVVCQAQPALARLAAGVFYAWNPYVAERLIIGHWALLLGYAALPWVLHAATRPDLASWRGAARLGLVMVPAVIGGFAAMTVTALVVIPAALLSGSIKRAGTALGLLAAGSLPWLIPSLLHPVYADPAGVAAFAARADTPFGAFGSLLMLGGEWNAQTVPKGYGGGWSALWLAVVLAALAGFILLGRSRLGRCWAPLCVAAAAGLAVASIGVTAPGRDLLRAATGFWPGIAVFRDAQQFVAPLALAEAGGLGLVASWAMNPGSFGTKKLGTKPRGTASVDAAGAVLGVLALLVPVLLLPGLAWGAAGRLRPAWYPASWLAAARMIDDSPAPGAVLLLPWVADRTPAWNHGERMLDPWSRLVSRQVIWNEGTTVGDVPLAPDDPQARRLDRAVSGAGPLTGVLRAAGVRFVIYDPNGPGSSPAPRLRGAVVLVARPGLTVYRLPG
jgi:hypothetical protein